MEGEEGGGRRSQGGREGRHYGLGSVFLHPLTYIFKVIRLPAVEYPFLSSSSSHLLSFWWCTAYYQCHTPPSRITRSAHSACLNFHILSLPSSTRRLCPEILDRLVGLVVRRPPREREVPGSNPASAGSFSGSSHTSDFKIGTPVDTLPGAWRYRVSTGTGRPGVSIL